MNITPPNPYLIRAFYDWLSDNDLTPHIIVVAAENNVVVPRKYVKNGEIILNISLFAVNKLRIGNDALECEAKFNGKTERIYVPIGCISAIYAPENNLGMNFSLTEYSKYQAPIVKVKNEELKDGLVSSKSKSNTKKKSASKSKPVLSLVKKK